LCGALAIITAIILLIDVVELSRTSVAQSEMSIVQVAGLTLLRSPILILQLLPFVFLFGVLAAFTGLNRRSELIAMRAAGCPPGDSSCRRRSRPSDRRAHVPR
jgi:lipopolysaccharide export system permease protein